MLSSLVVRSLSSRLAFSCVALAVLSACNRGGDPAPVASSAESAELTWARSALERNPQLEVLASDSQTRVFTVRHRASGQVETVSMSELAAAPVTQLRTPPAPAAAASSAPAAAPEPVATASTAEPARRETAPAPAAEGQQQVADTSPAAAAERAQASEGNYTIDRTGGQLRVSGPGVSIVSSGDGGRASSQKTARTRTVEPIICEGKRLLKLDDRDIYVDGDAIIARGGCELYITNSRIIASGTGLVVEDAIVHVANSHIEGVSAYNATDKAKMYVRTSTFRGVPRRAEFASVLDQGGNQWR